MDSWCIVYVRGEPEENGNQAPLPEFPNVGDRVVHFLGRSEDGEQQKKDKENPLWSKIQDGVRPAWAPDIMRLGYAVVFRRADLPRMAIKLDIKNPKKLREKEGGLSFTTTGGKRVLTFDDVWIVMVEADKRPFFMPSLKLTDEEWWLSTNDDPPALAAFIAPGGVKVMDGAHRLADIVAAMLATAYGYPRPIPPSVKEDQADYSEFENPLLPVRYKRRVRNEPDGTGRTGDHTSLDQYAAIELFRY